MGREGGELRGERVITDVSVSFCRSVKFADLIDVESGLEIAPDLRSETISNRKPECVRVRIKVRVVTSSR